MRTSMFSRLATSELLFGVIHTLVWLLLALEVSANVVLPLAAVFAAPVA